MSDKSNEDAYQWGLMTGELIERDRIIALLEAQDESPICFCDAIALIKGEE